jgi:autotransporter-associated beta strand protein
LTKTNTGTLILSGNNTYSGATNINAGTLRVAGGNGIGDASAVVLANVASAILDLNGSNETIGSLAGGGAAGGNVTLGAGTLTTGGNNTSTTYSGVMSGTGGLTKVGTGTMTLAGANTYTGATNINGGTLSISADNNLGTAPAAATPNQLGFNGGTLASTASFTLNANRGVALNAGGGTFNTAPGTTLSYGGTVAGTGTLTKTNTGTLILSGANTYTGATNINGGTLSISADNNLGTAPGAATPNRLSFNGGTLASTASFTLNANRGVALNAGGGTFNVAPATTLSYGGIVAGTGALTKTNTGTLILSGNNTYSGATNINDGTLSVTGATALGATGAGTAVANGATLNINGTAIGNETVTLNGAGAGGNGALTGTGVSSLAGAVTLSSASTIGVATSTDALTLSGAMNGPGALTLVGSGTVTLGSTVGSTTALASLTQSAATTLNLNGTLVQTTGSQSYGGPVTTGGATTLRTAGGNVTATGVVTATAGTLTLDTGAGNATLTNTSNNFGIVQVTSGNVVSLVDSDELVIGASNVGTITARTLSGNLTLGGNVTASGTGDSIVLAAAGNFLNPGSSALTAPPGGRWLVYSTDPANDNRGGLVYDFKQYATAFGGSVLGAGNGFLYTVAPSVTPVLSGSASRVYDGTATAPIGNLVVTQGIGVIDGDSIGFSLSVATYGDKNVGNNKSVTATGIAVTGASNGGKPVYGYQTASTSATANVGTITPAPLTVSAQTDSRVYNGTTSSSVAPTVGALFGTDTIGTAPSQAFDTKNAGTGKILSASGLVVNDGNAGANYTVSYLPDTTGVITPRPINGSVTANDKVYDGNSSATITSRTLTGVIAGDTLTYSGGSATFSDKNVGVAKTVSATGLALSGTDAGNYTVNGTATTTAKITAQPLSITADDKVKLESTSNPPFTATYSGFVTGEGAADLTGTLVFSTPATTTSPAGSYAITPSGQSSGNYAITYNDGQLSVSPSASALSGYDDVLASIYQQVRMPAKQTLDRSPPVYEVVSPGIRLPAELQQSAVPVSGSAYQATQAFSDAVRLLAQASSAHFAKFQAVSAIEKAAVHLKVGLSPTTRRDPWAADIAKFQADTAVAQTQRSLHSGTSGGENRSWIILILAIVSVLISVHIAKRR